MTNGDVPFGVSDPRPGFANPYSYLKKLTLQINGKSYDLESANMYNAWGNRLMNYAAPRAHQAETHMSAHCYDAENCTLRGVFSDAGGAYIAEWQIRTGKAVRTVLTGSSDLVHQFLGKGINPPVFV